MARLYPNEKSNHLPKFILFEADKTVSLRLYIYTEMKPHLVEVKNRKQLRQFITYPEKLYKDCPQWVPALIGDEFDTLTEKNAASKFCESILYLALNDKNEIVGRIAGIINHNANRDWNEKNVRFGWLDFINDVEVLSTMIDAVKTWGKAKGMTKIKGPLGFTDMDKEGLLVEGYENLSPFTCLYNYPYYGELLEQIGFTKDADWTQRLVEIPDEMPPMFQYANLVEERFGLHVYKGRDMRKMRKDYGLELFHLVNTSFAPLYEFSPLSDEQIERYLDTYVPILDPDFVCILLDADERIAGFAFCVPSLSKAVKKSNGRLFPFGFIRILKALKKNDTLEALMIGVLPEYQGKGATVLMFKYLHENCLKRGIKTMLANPQLETNSRVQSLWGDYPNHLYMRRRSYTMDL